ncbi:MAG: putative hydrolase [Alphaproteobacteria bacterium ADurb.Bin438]|nr:MAG: putative hydrolase [Alphaproteobacteria bacterium ADurb.Bin438]
MEIIILGSGSAYGTPYAGNFFGSADKNNDKNIRLRPSAYFKDGEDAFLIECGPDFRQQTCIHNINKIDNIFLSHGHADHIMGIWELTRFSKMMKAPINIFGNEATIKEVKERFSFMFKDGFKEMGDGGVILNIIKPYQDLKLPKTDLTIKTLNFIHKKQEILGFKYKNMVYTPDVAEIPEETKPYLENLDLWIFECDSFEDAKKGHNYLDQALKWINEFKPKRCILNHLNVTIDYNSVSKLLPSNTELAYDGMIVKI